MPDLTPRMLRLGTRGSLLAKTQSASVGREIEAKNPGVRVELVIVPTSGDRITDQPLHAFGGKGLFTKELELALLAGTVDFAVHSFKDVPVTMPLVDLSELIIAAVPAREDPRDALASLFARSINDLPSGAKVGTGSFRRRCQILAHRPDLIVEPIRGNIDTRLRKLREGRYHAVILAMAGLKRASLLDEKLTTPIEPDVMLPAPGQGALALQCRRDNAFCRRVLQSIGDEPSRRCVDLERKIVLGLNGDCHSPIAAYATIVGEQLTLRATVGARDGQPPIVSAKATASVDDADRAVDQVLSELRMLGVEKLLGEAN